MADKIVLYDLPCKGRCASWSGNCWKARLVLNYKGIPYRTEWVEHPDITPTCQKLGLQPAPNSLGSPYTVPVVILTDGTPIMDSLLIAEKLESLQPEPSIHLNPELQDECSAIVVKIGRPLVPVFMPLVAREVLLDSSVPWFREARKKAFGMELEELERQKGGEAAWEAAQPGLEDLSKFLVEHKRDEGPFVLGSQVSFVDFMIAGAVEGFRRIAKDIYDRFVAHDSRIEELHRACEPWMKDDQ